MLRREVRWYDESSFPPLPREVILLFWWSLAQHTVLTATVLFIVARVLASDGLGYAAVGVVVVILLIRSHWN